MHCIEENGQQRRSSWLELHNMVLAPFLGPAKSRNASRISRKYKPTMRVPLRSRYCRRLQCFSWLRPAALRPVQPCRLSHSSLSSPAQQHSRAAEDQPDHPMSPAQVQYWDQLIETGSAQAFATCKLSHSSFGGPAKKNNTTLAQ